MFTSLPTASADSSLELPASPTMRVSRINRAPSPAAEVAALSRMHPAAMVDDAASGDVERARYSRGSRLSSTFLPSARPSAGASAGMSPVDDMVMGEFSSPLLTDGAWIAASGRATPAAADAYPPSPRLTAIPQSARRFHAAHQPVPVGVANTALGVPGFVEALDGALRETAAEAALEERRCELELRMRDCENDPMAFATQRELAEVTTEVDAVRTAHHRELLATLTVGSVRC